MGVLFASPYARVGSLYLRTVTAKGKEDRSGREVEGDWICQSLEMCSVSLGEGDGQRCRISEGHRV